MPFIWLSFHPLNLNTGFPFSPLCFLLVFNLFLDNLIYFYESSVTWYFQDFISSPNLQVQLPNAWWAFLPAYSVLFHTQHGKIQLTVSSPLPHRAPLWNPQVGWHKGLLSEIPRRAGSTDTAMHTVGRRTEGGLEDFPCWASRSQLPSSKHSTQNLPELFPHRDLAQTHFSPLKTHLRTGLSALGSPFSSSIHPHSRQVLSQESLALGSAPGPKISKRPRAGESATYPLA